MENITFNSLVGRSFLILLLGITLTGCAKVGYLSNAMISPPLVTQVERPNADALDIYHFDTADDPQHALFFVSGSGCASLRYYLKKYFTGLGGSYRIFSLQKAGVSAFETGGRCSDAFNERYTADVLQQRNAAALDWVKTHFDGDIAAIIGVSEGGIVAASLAADHPDIERLMIVGSGAMTFREELMTLAKQRGEADAWERGFANVSKNPDSTTMTFLGLPHRYLTSMLDLDPSPVYDRVSQSVLLVAGEKDDSVPVESVRQLADRLKTRPEGHVTVNIISGANHVLIKEGRDMKPLIMQRLTDWLAGRPWPPL